MQRLMVALVFVVMGSAPVAAQYLDDPLSGYDPLFDAPLPYSEPPPPVYRGREDPFSLFGRRSQPADENIYDEALRDLGPSDTDRLIDYYQRRDEDRVHAWESCMAITNNDLARSTCLQGLR